jgi:hypothetical protein
MMVFLFFELMLDGAFFRKPLVSLGLKMLADDFPETGKLHDMTILMLKIPKCPCKF